MSKRKQTFQRPIRMGSPGELKNENLIFENEITILDKKIKTESLVSSASLPPNHDADFYSSAEKGINGDGLNDFFAGASRKLNGSSTKTEVPFIDVVPSQLDHQLTTEQLKLEDNPSPTSENGEEESPHSLAQGLDGIEPGCGNNKLAQLLTSAPTLGPGLAPWPPATGPSYSRPPAQHGREEVTQQQQTNQPGSADESFKLKDLLYEAKCRTPVQNGYFSKPATGFNPTEERDASNTINAVRPFACRECGFAFTNKSNCERHMRKKHGKKSRRELLKKYGATSTPTSFNSNGSYTSTASTRSSSASDDGTPTSAGARDRSPVKMNGSQVHLTYKCQLCGEAFGKQDLAIKHVVLNHPQVDNILETIAELETPQAAATPSSPQELTPEPRSDAGDEASSSEPLDFSISKSEVGEVKARQTAPPHASAAMEALHRWLPPNPFFGRSGYPDMIPLGPLGLPPTTPYYSPELAYHNQHSQHHHYSEEAEMCDGREMKECSFQDGGRGSEEIVGAELAAELPPTSPFFDPRAVPYRTPGPRKFVCVYCHNTYSSRGNVNRHIRNTHFKMKRTSSSSSAGHQHNGSGGVGGFTKRATNGMYSVGGYPNGLMPFQNGTHAREDLKKEAIFSLAITPNGRSSSTSVGAPLREAGESGGEKCSRSHSTLDRYDEEGGTSSPPPAKIKRESCEMEENGMEDAFRKYYTQYYYYPPYAGAIKQPAASADECEHHGGNQTPCPPNPLNCFRSIANGLILDDKKEQPERKASTSEDKNGLDLSLVASSRKKELTTLSSTSSNLGSAPTSTACPKPQSNGTNGSSSHSGMRPSPCPLCGLNFSTKSNRNRHIFRKHRQTYASIRGSFPVGGLAPHPLAASHIQNGGDTAARREEERDKASSCCYYSSDECEREAAAEIDEKMDMTEEESLPFACTICRDGDGGKVSFRDQASLLAHAFTRHKDELNTKYRNLVPGPPLSAKPDRGTSSVLSSYMAYFSSLSSVATSTTAPGSPETTLGGGDETNPNDGVGTAQQRQWLCTICRITFSLKHSLIRHHKRHAARSLNDPHNFVPVEMMLELSPCHDEGDSASPLDSSSSSPTTPDTGGSLCGSRVLQNLLGIHDAKELEHMVMSQGGGTGGVPSNA